MECEGGGSRFGDGEATRPEDFKNEAKELSRLLGRPEPQSIDGPPAEESGCAAHSSSASSCSASRTDLGSAEPGGASAPSSRACDVRPYPGLPPHGLSNEQIDELMEEVRSLKKRARPCNQELHGWRLIYTLRRNTNGVNRGDFCVIDPRDQQKIYSMVGLERKLGRADPLPWMALEVSLVPSWVRRVNCAHDTTPIAARLASLWIYPSSHPGFEPLHVRHRPRCYSSGPCVIIFDVLAGSRWRRG